MLDLNSLQKELSFVDLLTRKPLSRFGQLEQLILKKEQLKVKIYQETKHPRPHLHIDYGRENHVAAYAIDNGERLIGELSNKYDKAISVWVQKNHQALMAIWNALQSGNVPEVYIQELTNL